MNGTLVNGLDERQRMKVFEKPMFMFLCVAFMLPANAWICNVCSDPRDWPSEATCCANCGAWICRQCPDSRAWPSDATCCGNCRAKKSMTIRPSTPAPTYVPPPTRAPQPTPAYVPPQRSQSDMSSYDGHHVHMTPLHLGAWGSYLAIPPGEYYSVYGICANAMAVDVVDVYGLQVAYGYTIAKRDM